MSERSRVSETGQGWEAGGQSLPGGTTELNKPLAKQQLTPPFIRVKDVHDL